MEEIYSGFWAFEALRREVAMISSHIVRRYQISNKWTKKVVPDCKGKLNITECKMYVNPDYHSANQNCYGQAMEKLYCNGYPSSRSS